MRFFFFVFCVHCIQILTCFPLRSTIKIYKDRINEHHIDQSRTWSMNDTVKISPYFCFCCVSMKYLNKIALFNVDFTANDDALSLEQSKNLKVVAGSSSTMKDFHRDSISESGNSLEDMEEFGVGHTMAINAGEQRKNGKKIEFVQIKPANQENINIAMNDENMHDSLLSFLELDGALNLFLNHCAKEFCLEVMVHSVTNIFSMTHKSVFIHLLIERVGIN